MFGWRYKTETGGTREKRKTHFAGNPTPVYSKPVSNYHKYNKWLIQATRLFSCTCKIKSGLVCARPKLTNLSFNSIFNVCYWKWCDIFRRWYGKLFWLNIWLKHVYLNFNLYVKENIQTHILSSLLLNNLICVGTIFFILFLNTNVILKVCNINESTNSFWVNITINWQYSYVNDVSTFTFFKNMTTKKYFYLVYKESY